MWAFLAAFLAAIIGVVLYSVTIWYVIAPWIHHRIMGERHIYHRHPVACTWRDHA